MKNLTGSNYLNKFKQTLGLFFHKNKTLKFCIYLKPVTQKRTFRLRSKNHPMKTRLITLLFIFTAYFSFAQTKTNPEDQAIRKSIVYFVNTIKYEKIDQSVNSLYPKFFTAVSKEQITQLLNMTYNNPFIKIDVQDMKFGSVGKPELISGEYFSIANYYLTMKGDVSSMSEDLKKKIGEMMNSKYGKAGVKYNANEQSYIITAPMKVVAVSKDKKTWKLVFADKEYKSQLVKVLPKKVLDKL
jgi:hypothetical protein